MDDALVETTAPMENVEVSANTSVTFLQHEHRSQFSIPQCSTANHLPIVCELDHVAITSRLITLAIVITLQHRALTQRVRKGESS